MKMVAVYLGKTHSTHLIDMPTPKVAGVRGGRGMLVRILRLRLDGTDKEIHAEVQDRASDSPGGGDLVAAEKQAHSVGFVRQIPVHQWLHQPFGSDDVAVVGQDTQGPYPALVGQ